MAGENSGWWWKIVLFSKTKRKKKRRARWIQLDFWCRFWQEHDRLKKKKKTWYALRRPFLEKTKLRVKWSSFFVRRWLKERHLWASQSPIGLRENRRAAWERSYWENYFGQEVRSFFCCVSLATLGYAIPSETRRLSIYLFWFPDKISRDRNPSGTGLLCAVCTVGTVRTQPDPVEIKSSQTTPPLWPPRQHGQLLINDLQTAMSDNSAISVALSKNVINSSIEGLDHCFAIV